MDFTIKKKEALLQNGRPCMHKILSTDPQRGDHANHTSVLNMAALQLRVLCTGHADHAVWVHASRQHPFDGADYAFVTCKIGKCSGADARNQFFTIREIGSTSAGGVQYSLI